MATSIYVCLSDYEQLALNFLDKKPGEFFRARGANNEQTLSDITADFKRQV